VRPMRCLVGPFLLLAHVTSGGVCLRVTSDEPRGSQLLSCAADCEEEAGLSRGRAAPVQILPYKIPDVGIDHMTDVH